jgi:nucleoside-diphosphate kinase
MSGANNMIHGSDSPESAERELGLWFTKDELVKMDKTANQWIYDPSDLD